MAWNRPAGGRQTAQTPHAAPWARTAPAATVRNDGGWRGSAHAWRGLQRACWRLSFRLRNLCSLLMRQLAGPRPVDGTEAPRGRRRLSPVAHGKPSTHVRHLRLVKPLATPESLIRTHA